MPDKHAKELIPIVEKYFRSSNRWRISLKEISRETEINSKQLAWVLKFMDVKKYTEGRSNRITYLNPYSKAGYREKV